MISDTNIAILFIFFIYLSQPTKLTTSIKILTQLLL